MLKNNYSKLNSLNKEEMNILNKIRGSDQHDKFSENAVVCGINIKPIDSLLIKKGDDEIFKKKWGLFVHLKREDGSQIDFVYKLETTKNYVLGVAMRKLRNKNKIAVIPNVFNSFGVGEWVEMVGTVVRVNYCLSDKNELIAFPKQDTCIFEYYPDYFDLQPK